MDMNDNILGMIKVNERPFPIEFCVPHTTTPVAGTHTDTVNKLYYGKFLEELDEVLVHVNKVFMAPILVCVPKKTQNSMLMGRSASSWIVKKQPC